MVIAWPRRGRGPRHATAGREVPGFPRSGFHTGCRMEIRGGDLVTGCFLSIKSLQSAEAGLIKRHAPWPKRFQTRTGHFN